MGGHTQSRFADDPIATISGQFALCRPPASNEETRVGTRPWGLRDLVPATGHMAPLPPLCYDHDRQIAVLDDGSGRAFVDVVAGPPTAPTTQTTDGEDPPSSGDWINDFAPDDPSCPF